ncbi:MAG: hypothetical protein JJE39_13980 [Vicinamibacteria bacterium]|nr:hypothetical protein [Vicinamibacteria bacterium]
MVNLSMIDTQGGGIKRMFQKQMQRFFPMPDFNLTEARAGVDSGAHRGSAVHAVAHGAVGSGSVAGHSS